MIRTAHYDSPLGGILLASDGEVLTGLWFDDQKYFPDTADFIPADGEIPALNAARRWLDIYFSGGEPDFLPPLRMEGSPFRQCVWRILREIPRGSTMTYGQIARRVEQITHRRAAAQAVGGAVGHNPISIIVPCHRVLGANGSLTGYAGGMNRKKALLRLEGIEIKEEENDSMTYGIQLYGASPLFRAETDVFMKNVADLGYNWLEPCVQFGKFTVSEEMRPTLRTWLWSSDEIPGKLAQMGKYGLTIGSCHVFTDDLVAAVPEMLACMENNGIRIFVAGVGAGDAARIRELKTASEMLSAAGAELWLHNVGDDCRRKAEDCSLYEAVLRACPKLGAQIDTGWAIWGGEDPCAMAKRLGAQFRCIHIKEMDPDWPKKEGNDIFAVLGEGVSDVKAFLEISEGLPVIIDQDCAVRSWYDDLDRTMKAIRAAQE